MKKTSGIGSKPASAPGAFDANDKKKLIVMGVLLVLVAIAYLASTATEKKYELEENETLAENAEEATPELYVPPFDWAGISERIDDSEANRTSIERDALDEVLTHATLLTGSHYGALDTKNLDGELSATIAADPNTWRGKPIRVRGTIERLIERTRPGGGEYLEGRIRLEDDSPAFFVLTSLPKDRLGDTLGVDGFVRLHGLFLKNYREESDRGWEEGPLVVGRNAVVSYPGIDEDVSLTDSIFKLVDDDSVTEGPAGAPFEARWKLLAFARDLEEGEIDWETAPELNNETLGEILKNGRSNRVQPFRIPISKNMGTHEQLISENPARLEKITTGWIGNTTWTAGNGLVRFDGPFVMPELRDGDFITAKGLFFRNHLYEPAKGGAAIAPYFVLTELERFIPEEDPLVGQIFMFVGLVTLGLISLLFLLLTRDRKQARELQENLIRRRRERRAQQATGEVGS